MKNFNTLSPREAYSAYFMGSVIVDVRRPSEIAEKAADLNRMMTIPFEELDQRLNELPANRPIVFVSRIGLKGRQAAELIAARGFEKVGLVEGGLAAWEEEGLPVRASQN